MWGLLALGIFANDGGLIFGGTQILPQIYSIIAVVVWSLATGLGLFYLLKFAMGVRVTEAEELEGLDISEHGIQTYPESAATS